MRHQKTAIVALAAALSVHLFTASSPQVASATAVSTQAEAPPVPNPRAYANSGNWAVIGLAVLANAAYEGAKAAAFYFVEHVKNGDINCNEASWDGLTSLTHKRIYVPDVALDPPAQ